MGEGGKSALEPPLVFIYQTHCRDPCPSIHHAHVPSSPPARHRRRRRHALVPARRVVGGDGGGEAKWRRRTSSWSWCCLRPRQLSRCCCCWSRPSCRVFWPSWLALWFVVVDVRIRWGRQDIECRSVACIIIASLCSCSTATPLTKHHITHRRHTSVFEIRSRSSSNSSSSSPS